MLTRIECGHKCEECIKNMADYQSAVRTCKLHKLKELVIYCFTCGEPICFQCSREEHSSHECDALSNAARDTRSKIPEQCRSYKENILRTIREDKQRMEMLAESYGRRTAKVKETLKNLQSEISFVVQTVFQEEIDTLASQDHITASDIAHIAKLTETIDMFHVDIEKRIYDMIKYQTEYSDFDVLEMSRGLGETIKEYQCVDLTTTIVRDRQYQERLTFEQRKALVDLVKDICLPEGIRIVLKC